MLLLSGALFVLFLIMQPAMIYLFRKSIAVLFPSGPIALHERNLLFFIQLIMLFVIVPVFILTFVFSWKYRAGQKQEKYDPHLIDNKAAEYIWWGIPCFFTLIIAWATWTKTHELDPFKAIPSEKPVLTIQVVALQWKWLFIYPEEKVASLNFFHIPVETPIRFLITADAPMNSFWIPHLGGQIYAMPKMQSILNLIASKEGDFRGCSANLSGAGFSAMHFIARASSEEAYHGFIEKAKASKEGLDFAVYETLALPSIEETTPAYRLQDEQLFHKIIMKYTGES